MENLAKVLLRSTAQTKASHVLTYFLINLGDLMLSPVLERHLVYSGSFEVRQAWRWML